MVYYENPFEIKEVTDRLPFAFSSSKSSNSKYIRSTYAAEVRYLQRMKLHTEGDTTSDYAIELLHRQRPNEQADVLGYRIANLDAITKSATGKVLNVLKGIFNPETWGWSFQWDNDSIEYTPKRYFTEQFPIDLSGAKSSVVTWAKDILLHACLTDPNGVCLLVPAGMDDHGWPVWLPKIFNCDSVMHSEGYWLLRDGKRMYYADARSLWLIVPDGKSYEWILLHQAEEDREFARRLPHCLESTRRVSFIDSVLPFWEKALKDDSDKTAAKTLHAHPKWWEYNMPCSAVGCSNGTRYFTENGISKNEACKICGGTGIQKFGGPFGVISVTQKKDASLAPPFAGYIDPPQGILEFIASEIQNEIDEGFSAINMEFLRRTEGANESGYAKDLSRAELTTFMLNFSESIFKFLDWMTTEITALRYGSAYANWREYAPTWSPPTNFGIVTASTTIERIKMADEAKVGQGIKAKMSHELAELEFGEDSFEAMISNQLLELDPLVGMDNDTIAALSTTIRPVDLWIHSNFRRMVMDALDERTDWHELPRKERMKWLQDKAEAERTANITPFNPMA